MRAHVRHCGCGTYRDKNAVRVLGLAALLRAHEVSQALDVVDAHHVDVIVEAESLDEREVDLEGDVTLVLLICGEDAERHAIWVTVKGRREAISDEEGEGKKSSFYWK